MREKAASGYYQNFLISAAHEARAAKINARFIAMYKPLPRHRSSLRFSPAPARLHAHDEDFRLPAFSFSCFSHFMMIRGDVAAMKILGATMPPSITTAASRA